MYIPHTQLSRTRMRLAIRYRGEAGVVADRVRAILRQMDPDVLLDDVRTMDQVLDRAVAARRGTMAVLVVFALTALSLAGVGLYGVLAYRVSLRLREIGIRMALGASTRKVIAAVVRNGMILAGTGLAIGLAAALVAGRVMEGMLFAIHGTDPVTFAALVLVLGGAGALACVLPASRAARVSPSDVMRTE
jgi:putative ABC transport system permease protein